MAPEVLLGRTVPYNFKCDMYSLGCILYYMCTYEVPEFDEADYASFIDYSANMKSMVDKLLRKAPEERPDIDQVLSLCLA